MRQSIAVEKIVKWSKLLAKAMDELSFTVPCYKLAPHTGTYTQLCGDVVLGRDGVERIVVWFGVPHSLCPRRDAQPCSFSSGIFRCWRRENLACFGWATLLFTFGRGYCVFLRRPQNTHRCTFGKRRMQ